MIRDLEEQLLRIPRPEAREQMAEAVRCYHAGAHRAAIVMAFAAGMDDLRRKLADLAATGGASATLKEAVGHIETTFANQRAFEEDAINAAQLHAQVLSPDEAKALQSYLRVRHLCAHPSGYSATAEEARAVIARVIDSVLSRPATLGMVFVDALLQRLRSEHFFTSKELGDVVKTMAHELEVMSPTLIPALIAKLVEGLRAEGAQPKQGLRILRSPFQRNALAALSALALLPQSESLFWRQRAVQELVLSPDDPLQAVELLAARPAAISNLDDITRGRLLLVAQRNVQSAVVWKLLKALDTLLRPSEREELAQLLKRDFVDALSAKAPKALSEIGWSDLEDALVERLLSEARGQTYMQVNAAIDTADALTPEQVARITSEQRAEYLADIAGKAEGDYPSFRAQDRRSTGLGARADFIDAFVETAKNDVIFLHIREDVLHVLFEMFLASQRADAVAAVVEACTAASLNVPVKAREAASKSTDAKVIAALRDALPS